MITFSLYDFSVYVVCSALEGAYHSIRGLNHHPLPPPLPPPPWLLLLLALRYIYFLLCHLGEDGRRRERKSSCSCSRRRRGWKSDARKSVARAARSRPDAIFLCQPIIALYIYIYSLSRSPPSPSSHYFFGSFIYYSTSPYRERKRLFYITNTEGRCEPIGIQRRKPTNMDVPFGIYARIIIIPTKKTVLFCIRVSDFMKLCDPRNQILAGRGRNRLR